MKFICENKDCDRYGVEDYYCNTSYVVRNGHLQSKDAPCPGCGEIRTEKKEGEIDLSSISVGIYSSASKEGKQEMLKKRSHDHFQKHVKPFKEHQLHTAISRMKEASKK